MGKWPDSDPLAQRPRSAPRALGVASILVGAVSLIFNLILVVCAVALARVQPAEAPPPVNAFVGPAIPPAPAPLLVSAQGFDQADRLIVMRAMTRLRSLSEDRRAQLETLLARAGRRLLPQNSSALSIESVTSAIQRHGAMYSADANRPGADFFATAAGHVEIYDEHAVFYPEDNSPPVRTSARGMKKNRFALSSVQIESVLAQAQAASKNPLNPQQLGTLRALLNSPTQQLVSSGSAGSGVKWVSIGPSGGATLSLSDGAVSLGPQGEVAQAAAVFTAPSSPQRGAGGWMFLLAGAILGAGAAAWLAVTGIFTLMRSRAGAVLHLVYAGVKIPVALLATTGFLLLAQRLQEPVALRNWQAPASALVGAMAWGSGSPAMTLAVLYPVVILAVLWRWRVRSRRAAEG